MTKNNSFERIYPSLKTALVKFIAKRIGSDKEAVDEVFSRTVVAAWKGWGSFRHKSSYLTWFCAISLRKIADYYREQVHENSLIVTPFLENIADALQTDDYSPEEILSQHELVASIRECLKLVSEEKRRILYLRYWRDLTIKEIAKSFGTSERAVEGKIYRAKKVFKAVFSNKHPEMAKEFKKII